MFIRSLRSLLSKLSCLLTDFFHYRLPAQDDRSAERGRRERPAARRQLPEGTQHGCKHSSGYRRIRFVMLW